MFFTELFSFRHTAFSHNCFRKLILIFNINSSIVRPLNFLLWAFLTGLKSLSLQRCNFTTESRLSQGVWPPCGDPTWKPAASFFLSPPRAPAFRRARKQKSKSYYFQAKLPVDPNSRAQHTIIIEMHHPDWITLIPQKNSSSPNWYFPGMLLSFYEFEHENASRLLCIFGNYHVIKT